MGGSLPFRRRRPRPPDRRLPPNSTNAPAIAKSQPWREAARGVHRLFGLPLGWIVAVIDIALIVHAARTGRFMPWGFVILFLPGIGALAYVVVELVPRWLGSTGVRRAGQSLAAALDPERRYREAKEQLAIVDTIANRAALAEAALSLGKFDEARALYAAIVVQPHGDEPSFMLGRARANSASASRRWRLRRSTS